MIASALPRGPRLDAPGTLHHVMVRGIERRSVFRDDRDRRNFLDRLAAVGQVTGLEILAWALLPNHVHLLVRTGARPLVTAMRRLLTGYAGAFNRRHQRHGHLFQNRYKSIVVEEDPYLLELTRYIHLNPLRAGLVRDLNVLDRYPWAGHSALLGKVERPWQGSSEILGHFGRGGAARRAYRTFVAAGIPHGRRLELQGGGLRRSLGGWEGVAALRRGREAWVSDERVLGGSAFVARLLREAPRPAQAQPTRVEFGDVLARVAAAWGLTVEELSGGGRRAPVVAARYAASYLGVRELGLPATRVARTLSVSLQAVLRGTEQGAAALAGRGLATAQLLGQEKRK